MSEAPAVRTAGLEWMRMPEAETRILHRLRIPEGYTGVGEPGGWNVGVVVDVETTGLSATDDVIIELAMRRFRWDGAGRITEVGQRYSWLEDPCRALDPKIVRLTGLDDGMLAGQAIDEHAAKSILASATVTIAHNASFDRPRVESRLDIKGGPWACSCMEIDWAEAGFDGRSLGYLLSQIGFYNGAHRASDDVDSTIALLAHEVRPGRTALAELVDRSFRETWIVRANGAAFELKDTLKARGYRWDADRKLWWMEVSDRSEEEWWLAANVYAASANPKSMGPEWVQITNRERWA
ncbi:3'-5' exonuclease [uncultured Sphingomonas sp.]|uniref:3'-5' exonuclease n=1 Tax=uncultured Sphingomonas sp. TaxID=158754 RepID=UPI0025CC80D2|nr:3'-5' exonuclease [uncultured Sphingomonas sp.]